MRPPSCEVCGVDFDDTADRLVTFVLEPGSGRSTAARAERAVEHPENQGWFCGVHVEAARALAATSTLAEAVRAMRSGDANRMPDPSPPTTELAGPSWEAVAQRLRSALPALAAAIGLDDVRPVTESTREWTPMDGAEPPWCPYIDRVTTVIEREGASVRLVVERAHWNDDELARADVRLAVDAPGVAASVSVARGPGDGSVADVRGVDSLPEGARSLVRDALSAPQPRLED